MKVSRPVLRYFGSKFRLAPWIIENLPPHQKYVEPYGGGGNVILRKPRASIEVYNDLDDDVVNLFRVLREPEKGEQLISLLELTPFARTEFDAAYIHTDEPVERARRMVVRSFMGHGTGGSRIDRTTGFRATNVRANVDPSHSWMSYPDSLRAVIRRLKGVAIEHRPASDLIADRDAPDALFYIDPPYVHSTRSQKRTRGAPSHGYLHEMSDEDHVALLEQLNQLEGMVVLSGYDCDLYHARLDGWRRLEKRASADGNSGTERLEAIWLNPAAACPDLLRAGLTAEMRVA